MLNSGKELRRSHPASEPSALGDFLILDAVRSSNGFAIAVTDEETLELQMEIGLKDGVLLCPEGAATAVAYRNSLNAGLVSPEEHAILFNTATGLKYPMPEVSSRIDKGDVDFSIF